MLTHAAAAINAKLTDVIEKRSQGRPLWWLAWTASEYAGDGFTLIAFHEHRTFANAVLMGINPFDQFGVELGKAIAKSIEAGGAQFDPSTQALLAAAGIDG